MTPPAPARDTAIAAWIARRARAAGRPILVGIAGAQGSGKSTLAAWLVGALAQARLRAAVLSIDDLYLDPEDRPVATHPLFATRGVPGTHDVALGHAIFDAVADRATVTLPRFDKAHDRRHPAAAWPHVEAPDVLLFEGWCVGVPPQPAADLALPVNALEADEDVDAHWRRAVNRRLASDYAALFGRLDLLLFLAAPSFARVFDWRAGQEAALVAADPSAPAAMDADALSRFVSHYERLTRWALAILPARADGVAWLDEDRRIVAFERRA